MQYTLIEDLLNSLLTSFLGEKIIFEYSLSSMLMVRARFVKPILVLLFTTLFLLSVVNTSINVNSKEPIANLVIKTSGGGVRPNYCLYIAQYLREVGIEVEIKTEEWVVFLGQILFTHNYDLAVVGWSLNLFSPDMRGVYTETSPENICGITNDIPYINQSEEMLQEGITILELTERQQLYFDWQKLIMDRILPILPLYTTMNYWALWSNTKGYDSRWGLYDNLPYMSWEDYHFGQKSLDELNLDEGYWLSLNPLNAPDAASYRFISLIMDKLIIWSPDNQPLRSGPIYDWEKFDDFHYKFFLRENMFWNPSYNVSLRNENSPELSSIPSPELMFGLKNDEFSDGTNQNIKAKDAVFSILALANEEVSDFSYYFNWISDLYVDEEDEYAFHLIIDGNPETPEKEVYVDFWYDLSLISLIPEFFLNSTDITITQTSGGVECSGFYPGILSTPQWKAFDHTPFGSGMYQLDYYFKNVLTVMTRSPYWFGVGRLNNQENMVPFVETLNLRVIPDSTSSITEFRAGKLDLVWLTGFTSERRQMEIDDRMTVYSTLSSGYTFMIFNLARPFIGGTNNYEWLTSEGKEVYTKGVAIRKAISYSIDREEMNDVLHNGEYIICHSPIVPGLTYYYYNDVIKYNKDLKKAEEWLIAAGYDIEVDGTTFELFTTIIGISSILVIQGYIQRRKKITKS